MNKRIIIGGALLGFGLSITVEMLVNIGTVIFFNEHYFTSITLFFSGWHFLPFSVLFDLWYLSLCVITLIAAKKVINNHQKHVFWFGLATFAWIIESIIRIFARYQVYSMSEAHNTFNNALINVYAFSAVYIITAVVLVFTYFLLSSIKKRDNN